MNVTVLLNIYLDFEGYCLQLVYYFGLMQKRVLFLFQLNSKAGGKHHAILLCWATPDISVLCVCPTYPIMVCFSVSFFVCGTFGLWLWFMPKAYVLLKHLCPKFWMNDLEIGLKGVLGMCPYWKRKYGLCWLNTYHNVIV